MEPASVYRRFLATAGFFTLLAGDFWRYLLTWWGWGAIVLILLVLGIIELVRSRIDLRRLPLLLLATLALMALSIGWSQYRLESLIGVVATLVTTVFAVFLATCFSWADLIDALTRSTRIIIAGSFFFEMLITTYTDKPVVPLWVDYSQLHPIPAAFYWSQNLLWYGGRIQGIQGNANLFAMAALIALIAGTAKVVAGRGTRLSFVFWSALAILALALTRSGTVFVAAAVVAVVAVVAWYARRGSGARRVRALFGLIAFIGTAAVFAVVFPDPLLGLLGKSEDLTDRTEIWASVTHLAVQRPVAGWGWISYWAPWIDPFKHLAVKNGVTYLQAHNAWLDIFLQLGVIGLVVVGLYITSTLVRSWSYALDGPAGSALFPLALMVALLIQSLAESRLLIEIGWALLVIVSIRTASNRWERRELVHPRDRLADAAH